MIRGVSGLSVDYFTVPDHGDDDNADGDDDKGDDDDGISFFLGMAVG